MALSEIIALLRQKDKILYPITQLKNVTDDAEAKTAPADADSVPIADSADSGQMKKITWSNIKTALSSLFAAKSHKHSTSDVTGINGISITGTAEKVGSPIATKFLSTQSVANRNALQEKGGFAAGYLTSSATDGPPGTDHAALALSYDNAKWSVILAGDWRTGKLYVSTRNSGTWGAWKEVAYTDAATTSAAGLMSAADKVKLNGIATGANKYTHPAYTARTSGLYKITVDATGHVSAVTAVTKADITALGIPSTNTTYANMKGATTSAAGKAGLVPAPAAGAATRYLRSDGTWQVPPNTTYTLNSFGITATAAEINKLDGMTATKAELNYLVGVTSSIQTQLNGKAASSHNHSAVNITSGTLAVARGGTGATTAAAALKNLGLTAVFGVDSTGPYIKEL